MKNEFRTLEKSVIGKLSVTSFFCRSFSPEELQAWDKTCLEEMSKMEEAVRYQIFYQKNRKQLLKYISGNQATLVRILNHLHTLFTSAANLVPNESQQNLLWSGQQLAYKLEDFLGYLANEHTDLFNFDQYSSGFLQERSAQIFRQRLEPVQKYLAEHLSNPNIVGVILKPYREFTPATIRKYTYRKIRYLDILSKDLSQLVERNLTGEELWKALLVTLLYNNFNTTRLFVTYSRSITSACNEHESLRQQLRYLYLMQKTIRQIIPAPDMAYNPDRPSLQEQLKQWISEEVTYLETQMEQHLCPSIETPVPVDGIKKLHTHLSVAQLACVLKIYMETNAIKNESVSEVIRSFAKLVRTDNSRNISEESLRTKFYNVEQATCDRVKELLRRQLDYLDNV